jgi:hypothetical protein
LLKEVEVSKDGRINYVGKIHLKFNAYVGTSFWAWYSLSHAI